MIYRSLGLLLLLSCFTLLPATAQEVIYSPFNKIDFRTGSFSVVGNVGDRTYTYRGSAEGYYLDAYDDRMEHLATVILDFLPRKAFGVEFYTYADKILLLYQRNDGRDIVQYGVTLDEMGRMAHKPKELDRVDAGFVGGRNGRYNYAVSKNKEHIAVYATGVKVDEMDLRVVWLDDQLQKQSSSQVTFTTDNRMDVGEAITGDDGKFFISAYTPNGSRGYADQVWLLSLPVGGTTLTEVELPIGELYAAGLYMKIDKADGKLYVGGFYSDKKNGHFEGIIYSYYDITAEEFKEFKAIPFSDNLRAATGERNKKRAFNDFKVKELVVKNDGGFVMIAEDFFISTRTGYSSGFGYYSWYYPTMASSVREYNYGDIISISCDGNGKPEWTKFIRKFQYSQEDGGIFSSYGLVNTGGAIGFLYNDFSMNSSRVRVASLDIEGNINTKTLGVEVINNTDWLPRSGKQISSNEYLVPCLKRNQICFGKVVF